LLKIRNIWPTRLPDLRKSGWKRNPPASPGGLGRISLVPYPRAGAVRQQHMAQAVERRNIQLG